MQTDKNSKKPDAPDYKPYPEKDDIYNQEKELPFDEDLDEGKYIDEDSNEDEDYDEKLEEEDIEYEEDFDPVIQNQIDTPEDDDWNTENFDTDHTGDDLDVPGSDLDDDEEAIGGEDEENNYYSVGGPEKDD